MSEEIAVPQMRSIRDWLDAFERAAGRLAEARKAHEIAERALVEAQGDFSFAAAMGHFVVGKYVPKAILDEDLSALEKKG